MESKKIQPWYLHARVKFQVDFTHLSERDKFFYIHKKKIESSANMA